MQHAIFRRPCVKTWRNMARSSAIGLEALNGRGYNLRLLSGNRKAAAQRPSEKYSGAPESHR
ncbi:MAG: hypothetical protein Q4D82_03710 [Neisseria sp.]|nr:hypothetical protein [Neisseria sp.]